MRIVYAAMKNGKVVYAPGGDKKQEGNLRFIVTDRAERICGIGNFKLVRTTPKETRQAR